MSVFSMCMRGASLEVDFNDSTPEFGGLYRQQKDGTHVDI